MILHEVLSPQNMKINGQFKHTWKYFLHILSFRVEFHVVNYLTAKSQAWWVLSALLVVPLLRKLITQQNWKQATA